MSKYVLLEVGYHDTRYNYFSFVDDVIYDNFEEALSNAVDIIRTDAINKNNKIDIKVSKKPEYNSI